MVSIFDSFMGEPCANRPKGGKLQMLRCRIIQSGGCCVGDRDELHRRDVEKKAIAALDEPPVGLLLTTEVVTTAAPKDHFSEREVDATSDN